MRGLEINQDLVLVPHTYVTFRLKNADDKRCQLDYFCLITLLLLCSFSRSEFLRQFSPVDLFRAAVFSAFHFLIVPAEGAVMTLDDDWQTTCLRPLPDLCSSPLTPFAPQTLPCPPLCSLLSLPFFPFSFLLSAPLPGPLGLLVSGCGGVSHQRRCSCRSDLIIAASPETGADHRSGLQESPARPRSAADRPTLNPPPRRRPLARRPTGQPSTRPALNQHRRPTPPGAARRRSDLSYHSRPLEPARRRSDSLNRSYSSSERPTEPARDREGSSDHSDHLGSADAVARLAMTTSWLMTP